MGIIGNSQTTEWVHSPIADVALIETGAAVGEFAILANPWLGCLMKVTTALAVREHACHAWAGSASQGWFFAIGQVGDSAVLLWPTTRVTIGDGGSVLNHFKPCARVPIPVLKVMLSLREWKACVIEFKPPAWGAKHYPGRSVPLRLLPVHTSCVASLLQVAADNAFRELGLLCCRNSVAIWIAPRRRIVRRSPLRCGR